MSVFHTLACLFNQHRPVRRDVTWNGRIYVGVCRHCDTPIERVGRRRWRKRKTAATNRSEPSAN